MEWTFQEAAKRIADITDMERWRTSPAYAAFTSFIRALNESVLGVKTTADCPVSPALERVLGQLDRMSQWIDQIPPEPAQTSRYGNKAYRVWHARLVESLPDIHAVILPQSAVGASGELSAYLSDSFGNATRIDYGSGHEMAFVAWLGGLHAVGALGVDDRTATVTRVFARYLEVVRKLQTTYRLEPAGSHGVWGIDDFQFLPFLWGAAQLVDHPTIHPGSVLDPRTVDDYYRDYLYLGCIKFTTTMKKGPFHEHSPDLYNISAAASWRKINAGMFKKYEAEVLSKFPIVQHFFFGSIYKW
eukprot:m51a1_g4130 putative serine threonine-protein phosphatase 2a activator-like (301) ;mRNA; r:189638-190857